MTYTNSSAVSTETKVTLGILAVTALIIIGGLMMFKSNGSSSGTDQYSKYIQTGLNFSKDKVAPAGNPRIVGTGKGTAPRTASSTPIEIIEFMDYECPACATNGEVITQQLLATYGDRLTITRRIYPVHGEGSIEVARMVLAAQSVSKEAYEKLHTQVYTTQSTWAPLGKTERIGFFKKLTADLGLNYDMLVAEGKKPTYAGQIDADKAAAAELGIRATPSFMIGGHTRITGGLPVDAFAQYIDKN